MTTDKTLASRIEALASEEAQFDGAARILPKEDPLEVLLEEIDATVLASELRFDNGSTKMVLSVAGRRLQRISEIDGALSAPGGVADLALSMEDEAAVAGAAHFIHSFCDAATTLTVTAQPGGAQSDATDSLSVPALRRAMPSAEPDTDLPPLEYLENLVEELSTAVIQLQGGAIATSSGSRAHIASLKVVLTTQLKAFVEKRSDACPSHSDPSFTWFGDAFEPELGIGLLVVDDRTSLFTLPINRIAQLHVAFQRAL